MKNTKIILSLALSIILITTIFCSKQDSSQNEDQWLQGLRAFAKLYGYVKYFHPSDEASQIDWDAFAIYGVRRVLKVKNDDELKKVLNELYMPVAPTGEIYSTDEILVDPSQSFPEDTEDLKVVTWQHLGVWLGNAFAPYKSIRMNRKNFFPVQGWGSLTQEINVQNYMGKAVRVKAKATADMKGFASQAVLLLQSWGNNKILGSKMVNLLTNSDTWNEYEAETRIVKDVDKIKIGVLASGIGQALVDDFQVLVQNENNEWDPIRIDNPGFEEGDIEKSPSHWKSQTQGFKILLKSDASYSGRNCLLMKNDIQVFTGKLFEEHPEVGEVIEKQIGSNLFCKIPLALYSKEDSMLGTNTEYPLHTLKSELDAVNLNELRIDDESVRLAGVVIAWNVFQHFYPYFDAIDIDWDLELERSIQAALKSQSEEDFYLFLRRFVAQLQDGHGGVYHSEMTKRAGFPFKVDWIEDNLIITYSSMASELKKGDIVLTVDGVKAELILLKEEECISGSPQWKRFRSLQSFGSGVEGTTALLKIKRGDEIFEIEVVRDKKIQSAEPGMRNIAKLEEGVYYVNLDKAPMEEINEKMSELAEAKGIVFDLRGYPKGNHEVICHLLKEKDESKWMFIPKIIYPDHENPVGFEERGWSLVPKKPHIKGKVVFLTDGRAISYAESFMGYIEHYKLGEIVGQATAGANGNVNAFSLPGGFRVTFTGMKVTKHDGSQHHLVGIQPTVFMKRTIKGVLEGRDELLEKALEIIRK